MVMAEVPFDSLTIDVINHTKNISVLDYTEPEHIPFPGPQWDNGDSYTVKGFLHSRVENRRIALPAQRVVLVAEISGERNYMDDVLTNDDGYYEFIRTVNPIDNWQNKSVTFWVYATSAALGRDVYSGGLIVYVAGVTPEGIVIPTIVKVTVETPTLPWYAAWLAPVMDWISNTTEWLGRVLAAVAAPFQPVADFFKDPIGVITKRMSDIFKATIEESITTTLKTVADVTSHTPEWKADLDAQLKPVADDQVKSVIGSLSPEKWGKSPLTHEEAAIAASGIAATVTGTSIALWLAHSAAEAASLGQFEAIKGLDDMVIAKLGLGSLGARVLSIPLDELVFKRTQQWYASLFTPEIPDTAELINEVVKEVMTPEEFALWMKYKGFGEDWSKRIYDAHFIAPSLGQILTSFRRGRLTADDVKKLQILVDLDPRYDNIWLDQWYVDPSITMARFMFETGAIDRDRVRDIVVRNGIVPEYVGAYTDFITRFQERLWRRRYIMQVATGYRRGVFDADRLRGEILKAGYSEGVAEWMIKTEDVRREVEVGAVKPEKYKLVTQSFAEDLFEHGDIDESWMQEYFSQKGYDEEDVKLSMIVFNRKRDEYRAKLEVKELG